MDSRLLLLTALLRGSLQPAEVAAAIDSLDASHALLERLSSEQREDVEAELNQHGKAPSDQKQSLIKALQQAHLADDSLLALLPDDWGGDQAEMTIDRPAANPDATIDRPPANLDAEIDRPSTDADTTLDPGEHRRVLLQPSGDRQTDPHSITRFLAEGSQGQVYVAQDTRLGREVVLKQLHSDNDETMSRFMHEAQVTGQLEHPNIVPVYGLGWDKNNSPYYTMKYVRGRTLGDLVDDYHQEKKDEPASRILFRELLEAFISVCNAVGYSHTRNIIHRDLKPDNIAVGEFGEVMVLDWGLAEHLGQPEENASTRKSTPRPDQGQVLSPQIVGTPNYMPPEQARGEIDMVDTRADIYSLGAILFYIIAGRPPRHPNPENFDQLIEQVAAGQIPALRQLDPQAPKELDAICTHALQLQPDDRYQQVASLSDDLKQWLAREPVSVYPEPWFKKTARWARNHKTMVTTISSIAVVTLGILASATVLLDARNRRTQLEVNQAIKEQDNFNQQRLNAERNKAIAEQQRDIARQVTLENRRQLIRQNIASGMTLAEQDRPFQALLWFAHAYQMDNDLQSTLDPTHQVSMEDHQLRIHNILARCPLPVQIWQPEGGAGQVCFSPSSTVLATSNGHPGSPSAGNGQARLWDALSGEPLSPPLMHDESVNELVFHHDGTLLATAAGGRTGAGSSQVWRVPSGEPAGPPIRHPTRIVRVAFHPDGKILATATADGSAQLWQIASGEPASKQMQHDDALADIAFRPDGSQLVTASGNHVQLWDAATGEPVGEKVSHTASVISVGFSAFRNGILAILSNGNVVYSPSSQPDIRQALMGTANGSTFRATATAINPRETSFAAGDESGRIFIYAGANQLRGESYQLGSRIEDLQFSANGQLAVASTRDGHVVVLNSTDTTPLVRPFLHPHAVESIGLSADGRFLATACRDGLVRTWDLAASMESHAVMEHGSAITAARFYPGGDYLVTSSSDKSAVLWDYRIPLPQKTSLFSHAESVGDCFLSSAGKQLITIHGNSASNWVLEDPSAPLLTMQHGAAITDAHVGTEGKLLVTSSADRTAAIWDISTGQQILRLADHDTSVRDAHMSANGEWVVTAAGTPGDMQSSTVEVWNGKSGERIRPATIVPGLVHSVRFLPAIPAKSLPPRVLTLTGSLANQPGTARLWDLNTGEPVGLLMEHGDAINFVDISDDGLALLTSSRDTTARLWSTVDGSPLTPPLSHPASVLSCDIRPDGLFLVTACKDGSTHIWDRRTGNPILQGPLHDAPVRVITFGPAGKQVLSADENGIARFWRLRGEITNPETAQQIAQLISGHHVSSTSQLLPVPPAEIIDNWQTLQPVISQKLEVTTTEQFHWLKDHGVAVAPRLWLFRAWQLSQLIQASPREADHLLQRGYAYVCAGEYEKAMQDYLSAYEIDSTIATLTRYCYLAAFLGQRDDLATAIGRMLPAASSHSDKARVLACASLLPDLIEDYAPLVAIADDLSTEPLLANVYVRFSVGAIFLRSGDLARASRVLRGTPTGDSRSLVSLTTTFLYFSIAEQKQDNTQAAATLNRVARDFMKRQPQMDSLSLQFKHRKPGPLWFEYMGQQLLLREYQELLKEE
ncbi:MAG: protein kinase [Planctomycetota bacterium]|nr:protein kinase [Planctomycetota bacterium]